MLDEKEIYTEIGRRIRDAREAANLTQEELGTRVGLKRTSITNIEKARQSIQVHTLYSIAEALDLPISSFMVELRTETPTAQSKERLEQLLRDRAPDLNIDEVTFVKSLVGASISAPQRHMDKTSDNIQPASDDRGSGS
ncbi:MAG: XRE family transcriptional regulator [Proteobacteria bacterium]|nr:MAG: XRE family transcriptional regulator [Pseudomonadota bacterium]